MVLSIVNMWVHIDNNIMVILRTLYLRKIILLVIKEHSNGTLLIHDFIYFYKSNLFPGTQKDMFKVIWSKFRLFAK